MRHTPAMSASSSEHLSEASIPVSAPPASRPVAEGLGAGPRRFLTFAFLNVISWQCIMGPPLVLFARKLAMPPAWVGLLISFLGLSMVFVAITTGLVARFGPKRLMLVSWLLRDLVASSVFLVPVVLAQGRTHAAWYVLAGATMGFCALRAVGVAGWFPWLHELIPDSQRGTYFSRETLVVHGVNVAVLLGQGLLLSGDPQIGRFVLVYGIGIAAGFLSLAAMARVPGGRRPAVAETPAAETVSYRAAFGDRRFMLFVAVVSVCFSSVSWLQASLVLFMRDALALPSMTILAILSLGSVGTMATINSWGRFADHSGSGRAMFKTLGTHGLVALFFLALVPGRAWTVPALVPAVALSVVFSAAFFMAANRAMLGFVPAANRIAYSNIWVVGTSLAVGLTPIAAGCAIDLFGMSGFRVCFVLAGAAGLAGAVGARLVVPDGAPLDADVSRLLNPVMPLRLLARIFWITVGSERGFISGPSRPR